MSARWKVICLELTATSTRNAATYSTGMLSVWAYTHLFTISLSTCLYWYRHLTCTHKTKNRDRHSVWLSTCFFFLTVLSHWYFTHRKFGLFYQEQPAVSVTLPNLWYMLGVVLFSYSTELTWTTGSLMCTHMWIHAITNRGILTS